MSAGVKLQQETIVLLGAGFTARALIPHLLARGMAVIATTRSDARELEALGVSVIYFDGAVSEALKKAVSNADYILTSIGPNKDGDPVINSGVLSDADPKWAGYLSATSVYGDRGGRLAFEDEPPTPATRRGRARADAEIAWIETDLPVHIFRLAGIYGPGRSPFEKTLKGEARAVIKSGHVVNRIHVDDICSAVLASMDAPDPQRIYNIADDAPAPPQDVLDHAADLLGAARPPRVSPDDPNVSRMARTFYSETKRVDTSRAKRELGWSPHYPTYREGLAQVLKAENHTPVGVTLTGYIDVPPADLPAVKAALPQHIRATQDEPGCITFRVTQDAEIETRFHVYERFESAAAFKAHQARAKGTAWAKAAESAVRVYDVFGAEYEKTSLTIIQQRIRNGIIDYFDTSFAEIAKFGTFETLNSWEDYVPQNLGFSFFGAPVFSPQEQNEIRKFSNIWNKAAEETNEDIFDVSVLANNPLWIEFLRFAQQAYEVFSIRGKFSDDLEIF